MRSQPFFKPYVSAAARKAQAAKEAKALAKQGRTLEPIGKVPQKIATSFWGRAWCQHLESFSDYANRLPRGRTYVRNGSVIHLGIAPGTVSGLVQGSSLYEESIHITPLPAAKWKALQSLCRGKIGSLIELLQGKISAEIMAVVTDPRDGLFPHPKEIKLACNCPDWAVMCKHVAAVLYGVGARLDARPELLFTLRGVDHTDLITSAAQPSPIANPSSSSRRRTLDPAALNDVFGIDLDPTPPSPTTPPPKSPAKSPAKSARKPNDSSSFMATGATVRALRLRLGLEVADFAFCLRVPVKSIKLWESKAGPLTLNPAVIARLSFFHSEI
jgi:uncharacterized Zn finger protein